MPQDETTPFMERLDVIAALDQTRAFLDDHPTYHLYVSAAYFATDGGAPAWIQERLLKRAMAYARSHSRAEPDLWRIPIESLQERLDTLKDQRGRVDEIAACQRHLINDDARRRLGYGS